MGKKEKNNSGFGIYSMQIIEFVTVANEFCKLLENPDRYNKRQFIETTQKISALLYLKSILINYKTQTTDTEIEKFVTENDWTLIKESIQTKLGDVDLFLELFDADLNENINISISESLADIYQDLKDFLMLYEIGFEEAVNEGLFELSLNFETIWGPRVLLVLREFHNLLFSKTDLDSENTQDQTDVKKKSSNALLDNLFNKN